MADIPSFLAQSAQPHVKINEYSKQLVIVTSSLAFVPSSNRSRSMMLSRLRICKTVSGKDKIILPKISKSYRRLIFRAIEDNMGGPRCP